MTKLALRQLARGCEHVYTEQELAERLASSERERRPLRIKLGLDPTAPDIHLGHSVVLRKLRQFQDLGHKAVMIIGDFTARIGDPTGRSQTRPVLSDAEIDANAQTYFEQAGRILDTSPERLEIRKNSEWLDSMRFADVIRLAGKMTVQQMLKREDFRNRYEREAPISVHEFLYPLAQGWDSVSIAADVELGGTDQTYNNLVGRDLQTSVGQKPQVVMVSPLLRGTDGVKKMSKSLGNYIALTDSPRDFVGKTMSIPDGLLDEWCRLLTDVSADAFQAEIKANPMAAKQQLAVHVGAPYHGLDAMRDALEWWRRSFSARNDPPPEDLRVPAEHVQSGAAPAWMLAWLAHGAELSRSEARRLVQSGAFLYDGRKLTDPNAMVPVRAGVVIRAGRHRKGERIKQPLLVRIVIS